VTLDELDESYLDKIRWINRKDIREDLKQGFIYVLGHKIWNEKVASGIDNYDAYMKYFNEKYPGNENILKESLKYFIQQHPDLESK
jgi:hypothetical protein